MLERGNTVMPDCGRSSDQREKDSPFHLETSVSESRL